MKSRLFAVTTLISALAAGVMPAVAGEPGADWPMFRGDLQLTGVARGALPADLATRWTFTRDEAFSATAAIVDDTVYAACEDGVLYALDLADGSLRWQYAGGEDVAFRASPTVAGGTVYLGDDLGVFHAVDAQTGARRWVFQTEGEIVSSALVIVERVVFGSYDGTLYCLDTKDGSKLWAAETEDRLHATPSLFDESLLIGGCDGKLHVIDLKSGKAQAGIELDAVTGASAAVSGKLAYLGTHGNEVLAVDFARRKVAWRYHHPERQFPFMSSAAVFDERSSSAVATSACGPWMPRAVSSGGPSSPRAGWIPHQWSSASACMWAAPTAISTPSTARPANGSGASRRLSRSPPARQSDAKAWSSARSTERCIASEGRRKGNHGSKIENRESKIENRRSGIENRRSKIKDQ
jgi:hypothetical protein